MLKIYDEKGKNRLNLSGEAFKEMKNDCFFIWKLQLSVVYL